MERNVFGLKPPPPPPDPEANKPPPPKITLQGITTFGGIKRALFKVQMPPKPGDPAKGEQSFILAEGQRDGDIEVLEINDEPGSEFVKVNNFGTITNLNFANNGIKTAGAPAPAAARPSGFAPPPGGNPFGPGGGPKAGSPAAYAPAPDRCGGLHLRLWRDARDTSQLRRDALDHPLQRGTGNAPRMVPRPAVVIGRHVVPARWPCRAWRRFPQLPPVSKTGRRNPRRPEEQAILDAAYTMKNKEAIDERSHAVHTGQQPAPG